MRSSQPATRRLSQQERPVFLTQLRPARPLHHAIKGPAIDVAVSDSACFSKIDRTLRLNTDVRYGRGSFGSVYQVCSRLSGDCNVWAAKLVPLWPVSNLAKFRASEGDFKREVRLTKLLSDLGVGATMLGSRVCDSSLDPHRKI